MAMHKKVPVTVGERFGKLVVISRHGTKVTPSRSISTWLCKCDCGGETIAAGVRMREGGAKSCGCSKNSVENINKRCLAARDVYRKRYPELTGTKFGRLLVLEDDARAYLRCRCDCGTEVMSRRTRLFSGRTQSCGCLKRENCSRLAKELNRRSRENAGLPLEENIYERQPLTELSRKVKYRDNFTCVLCSERGGRIVSHHIQPWFIRRDLYDDPKNMVTLCVKCHSSKAHAGGFKVAPDPKVAEILSSYVRSLPLGGELEKNANLVLSRAEIASILSGVVPDRITRNWEELSLAELIEIATHNDIHKELQR